MIPLATSKMTERFKTVSPAKTTNYVRGLHKILLEMDDTYGVCYPYAAIVGAASIGINIKLDLTEIKALFDSAMAGNRSDTPGSLFRSHFTPRLVSITSPGDLAKHLHSLNPDDVPVVAFPLPSDSHLLTATHYITPLRFDDRTFIRNGVLHIAGDLTPFGIDSPIAQIPYEQTEMLTLQVNTNPHCTHNLDVFHYDQNTSLRFNP